MLTIPPVFPVTYMLPTHPHLPLGLPPLLSFMAFSTTRTTSWIFHNLTYPHTRCSLQIGNQPHPYIYVLTDPFSSLFTRPDETLAPFSHRFGDCPPHYGLLNSCSRRREKNKTMDCVGCFDSSIYKRYDDVILRHGTIQG